MVAGIEIKLYQGLCSSENMFTQEVGGCIVTVIYVETLPVKPQGILTHYPPFFLQENINKLHSLRSQIVDVPLYQSAKIFYKRKDPALESIKSSIDQLFPKIQIEEINYRGFNEYVTLMPSLKCFESWQNGKNYF